MTRNRKLLLLSLLCIFVSGFLVSYKSYKIHQVSLQNNLVQAQQEKLNWISGLIEQKLMQLESSVSYLDQSTIETLKRNGARYFAYAYQQNEEWSLKWKVLGETKKEQILAELEPVKFDQLKTKTRHWKWSAEGELIYITPVQLAQSHQLKNGFLVFGLNPDFFSSLQDKKGEVLVFAGQRAIIDSQDPEVQKMIQAELKNWNLSKKKITDTLLQTEKASVTPYFSQTAQLWIIFTQPFTPSFFLTSSFFVYFLLALLLTTLLFMVLVNPFQNTAQEEKSVEPLFNFKGFNLDQIRSTLRGRKNPLLDPALKMNKPELEVISDFPDYIDQLLQEEMGRLSQLGIHLKTQLEEGAQVACSPQHLSDFIKRLIGNSVLSLENEKIKEIQIQLVEQSDSYQLIYLDSRRQHLPSGSEPSLLLQTEGSLVGIDGIIAYGSWLFGQTLTVAKNGFCLSIDLPKKDLWLATQKKAETEALKITLPPSRTIDDEIEESIKDISLLTASERPGNRFEINEEVVDEALLDQFRSLNSHVEMENKVDALEEPELKHFAVTTSKLEEVIAEFRLKDLDFKSTAITLKPMDMTTNGSEKKKAQDTFSLKPQSVLGQNEVLKKDKPEIRNKAHNPFEISKGLFEFSSGNFKIKVRSPKKRDMDVNNQEL